MSTSIVHTPYRELRAAGITDDALWWDRSVRDAIDAAAVRHCVSAEDVHLRLGAEIMEADTPAGSIERAAETVAELDAAG